MRICPVCHLRYHDGSRRCLVDDAVLEAVADPRLGTTIGGRYLLESVLGRGGMASVYRARHVLTDQVVAVKVLHDRFAEDLALRERLAREAQSARTLAHPNVVQIFDVGEADDGVPYLVMELLEGQPLDQVLKHRKKISPSEAIGLGLQIARGLGRAHDLGVVHRDVKPENVFVCRSDDGEPVVKLVDFGIAISPQDPRLTFSGQLLGSPRYMAPERFKDRLEVIPSSDLYALGILLFELCAGVLPFESTSMAGFILAHLETPPPRLRASVPEAPPALDQLVFELMQKDPSHRPVDAHAVVAALSSMASDQARRVRRASTFVSLRDSRGGLAARLVHWIERARVYGEMLDVAFPAVVPDTLAGELAELHAAIGRLRALDARARVLDESLARRDQQLMLDRERLGHAVETLAQDLSRARDALRRSSPSTEEGAPAERFRAALAAVVAVAARFPNEPRQEVLDALHRAVDSHERWLEAARESATTDLEFQLGVLRGRLESLEADDAAARERESAELRANAEERGRLEERLVILSTSLANALRPRPELAPLFHRLTARAS
ncbi:MAG: protein kinase [Myxococcales bacterium]|nr:protein kinase [Myxococcales bacterium]